jgi:hypothetical protein
MSPTTDKASSAPPSAPVPKPAALPLGYIWLDGSIQIDPELREKIL